MLNALRLPDGDVAPRRIAEAALLAGDYAEPEPVFVLTDDTMTAVRFLCALIEGLDALPHGAGPIARSGMIESVVRNLLPSERLDALSTLEPYVRPYRERVGARVVPVEPLRRLGDHIVSTLVSHIDT